MASRSTRNKVRFQAVSALADLRRAEIHLTQLASLADERSDYINSSLPELIASLSFVIGALDKFQEGL
uniref:Uncharacterized protein n=1 Tax=viral metagenome TaxID=1070528 RepID=A0A6M3LDH3_9ZZZZ